MEYSSTLSQPNPSSPSMSPSNPPQIKSESEPESPIRESLDPVKPDEDASPEKVPEEAGGGGEEGEEEEGECGFCLFMKAGGCRETFTDWEKCVEEGEKNKEDIVEKCFQVTSALKKCMEAHSDYYAPLLEAEEAAVKQLEAENEKEKADQAAAAEDKLGVSEEKATI